MQGVNLIAVFNKDTDKVLMCKRRKDPYKGLLNFVGGKIEQGEKGIDCAYRELFEETGLMADDVKLTHLMDFTYHLQNFYMEVYFGKLNCDVDVFGEENELYWIDINENFFDLKKYAGVGNVGHIISVLKHYI